MIDVIQTTKGRRGALLDTIKCSHCGKVFIQRQKRTIDGRGVFCSKECYSKSMMKVDKKSKLDINKDYRHRNKDKYVSYHHNRRALEKELGGKFTGSEWNKIKEIFDNRCAMCHKEVKLTVDHIIPLTKWVVWAKVNKPNYKWNDKQNLQPLCGSCNSSKNNKIMESY